MNLSSGISIIVCTVLLLSCAQEQNTVKWQDFKITFLNEQEGKSPVKGDIVYFNYLNETDIYDDQSIIYRLPSDRNIKKHDNVVGYALSIGTIGDTIRIEMNTDIADAEDMENSYLLTIKDVVDDKTFAERQIKNALGEIPDSLLNRNREKEIFSLIEELKKEKEKMEFLGNGIYMFMISEGVEDVKEDGELTAVYYKAILEKGTKVVDNNYNTETPFILKMGNGEVITGWEHALQYIPAGSRVIVFIPAEEAYGKRGYGDVPPDNDLVFLMDVY